MTNSSYSPVEALLNRAAAIVPLLEKSDLSPLAEIQGILETLAEDARLPAAFTGAAARGARLSEHIILEETAFEPGVGRLGECIEKLIRSVRDLTPSAGGEGAAEKTGAEGDEREELLRRFAAQQRSVLEDFEAAILELEKGDPQSRGALQRMLHTWKGELGVLDLQYYARLVHDVEEGLGAGTLSTDDLLRIKDFLNGRFESFAAGSMPTAPVPGLDALLSRGRGESDGELPGGQVSDHNAEATADGPDRAPGSGGESGEPDPASSIPTSGEAAFQGDPSLMGDFVAESRDHIHSAESILLELESDPANLENLNSVFRSCHTIKGVAGFLGLREVNALAHAMENVLDRARRGDAQLGSAHIDLLLESMDCMSGLVTSVEEAVAGQAYRVPASYEELLSKLRTPESRRTDEQSLPSSGGVLGEILVERGRVTPDAVGEALRRQQEGDTRRIGEILIEEGKTDARSVGSALAGQSAARRSRAVEETIRVPVSRLDQLVDAIGEAVIAHSMIAADSSIARVRDQALEKKIAQADTIMRTVQELSMSLRMVSIKSTFQKMARLVRDLSKKRGKDIDFLMEGEETELDKSVVENIGDPLIHMVRNAVDHGIEDSTEARVRAGKPARASVTLRAFHKAGNIYIEIEDDGRGLDREAILDKAVARGLCTEEERSKLGDQEVYQFIFRPGFSTAREVTDVSGRGVGMDVVKRNIQALRGSVEIHSERGQGTRFSVRLPLTLAIIDGMIVRVESQTYIVPTLSIIESLRAVEQRVESVLDRGEMVDVRGGLLKLVRLSRVFGLNGSKPASPDSVMMIVEDMLGKRIALLVDEIVGQQQVVIKNLGKGLGAVPGVAGAAIMGDGNVSLILDVGGIIQAACD